ncbi:mitogen-activated protein kinase kinase kinase 17-like [Phragmites australis]|uniref:mitogen-activated protein kinase kinase kinase 17-like n=1 Tax=Phragmites australis TaxID=29695 RepID=UPI002D77209F|nr:mitogen-activated protein kinase kinase kinase 17-like [Phragmites australis]
MDAAAKKLRRLRTLGRGASGAVVWLASDEASGQLLAVKSAGPGAAEQLRREGSVLSGLRSPHIVPCLGSCAEASGEYMLFLEFAPRGSLDDEAARNGGCLEERAIRTYAADVARGLTYLHGESLVHGDVKAANIMVGADGRAKLADFGCARRVDCERPIGGSPAFMAPEVARGEEQGTAADVWALACTVIEMATGAAPWSDVDDVFAAVHKIGFTDAVPEVPTWLSAEAKSFLRTCLVRNPRDRPAAAQLLEHPFLASATSAAKRAKHDCASPKSTLNAAFWESDGEDDVAEVEASESAAERISSLASPCSALPDWDSEEGWIEVRSECSQVSEAPAATVTAGAGFGLSSKALDAAEVCLHVVDVEGAIRYPTCNVGVTDDFVECERQSSVSICSDAVLGCPCNGKGENNFDIAQILPFHDLVCGYCLHLLPFEGNREVKGERIPS